MTRNKTKTAPDAPDVAAAPEAAEDTRSADFSGPYTTLTDEAQGGTWEDAAPEAQHAFYQIWLLP